MNFAEPNVNVASLVFASRRISPDSTGCNKLLSRNKRCALKRRRVRGRRPVSDWLWDTAAAPGCFWTHETHVSCLISVEFTGNQLKWHDDVIDWHFHAKLRRRVTAWNSMALSMNKKSSWSTFTYPDKEDSSIGCQSVCCRLPAIYGFAPRRTSIITVT